MDEEIKILTNEELDKYFTTDALKQYMQEIKKYPKLSVEEQKELFKQGKIDWLIKCNLRLVVSVAYQYKYHLKHVDLLDVIQEGNIGLMMAVKNYDPSEWAFTTHALPWIRAKINQFVIKNDSLIKKPEYLFYLVKKYRKLVEQYKNDKLPFPDKKQVCEILDISSVVYDSLMEVLDQKIISINEVVKEDGDTEFENFIADDKNVYYDNILNEMTDRNLMIVLKSILKARDYFIIYHRHLAKKRKSLDEIAGYFNLSRQRINQIEISIFAKIKPFLEEDSPKYLTVLNNVKNKGNIDNFKTSPVEPIDIIKYLYVKDELSSKERKLLEFNLFGHYTYNNYEYEQILMVNEEEFRKIEQSLKSKIDGKFKDQEAFKKFYDETIKNEGIRIFNCFKLEDINYQALKNKYDSLDLETISNYFAEVGYELDGSERELIDKYFRVPQAKPLKKDSLEQKINILKYGFKRKNKNVSYDILWEVYLKNKKEFTYDEQNFIEEFIFNQNINREYLKNNPLYSNVNSRSAKKSNYINILEKMYYHIYGYHKNTINKDIYLELKNKYAQFISSDRIKVMDLYFGVNSPSCTAKEIAFKLNEPYDKLKDFIFNTIEYLMSLYVGKSKSLNIDKNNYIPYVISNCYEFADKTREILKLFLIGDLTYQEIANKTNLSLNKVANIINDGLRRCDYYRFKLIEPLIISKDELNDFYRFNSSFSNNDKEIIELKYIDHLSIDTISLKLGLSKEKINLVIGKFNNLYKTYLIKDTTITNDDYQTELNKHPSEKVLNDKESSFIALYLGIKCSYNEDEVKLNKDELMTKFELNNRQYSHLIQNINKKMKERKQGILKPFGYIERDEISKLIDDVHLPISREDKIIICHLFGLKGYDYYTPSELTKYLSKEGYNLTRKYQRIIINIYKYLNKEIPGEIDFTSDIVPNLKYFTINDRAIIIDFYQNGLTYEALSQKYNYSLDKIINIMARIKFCLYELINNPDAKRFDFDYYEQVKEEETLPYYGDISLAKKVFDMHYKERLDYNEIVDILNLNCQSKDLSKTISNLMLSVCKFQSGFSIIKTFSNSEIEDFYEKHQYEMTDYEKEKYITYFKRASGDKGINEDVIPSYAIIFDLIKEHYPDYFQINASSKEEIIYLIMKYFKDFTVQERNNLMMIFGISERIFMNDKEIDQVYHLLNALDERRQKLEIRRKLLVKKV